MTLAAHSSFYEKAELRVVYQRLREGRSPLVIFFFLDLSQRKAKSSRVLLSTHVTNQEVELIGRTPLPPEM